MSTVVIVQARMGSKRFPGKILAPLKTEGIARPVLAHVLDRVSKIPKVDGIILATPRSADHEQAWAIAEAYHVEVHKGKEQNVLDRYYQAATDHGFGGPGDVIVRVTADCPLIDPRVCHEVITLRAAQRADYCTNVMPRTYPKGYDCEAFTFECLEAAWCSASSAYEREHVTPWMQQTEGLSRANLRQKVDMSDVNFCVDYPGDIARIELLITTTKGGPLVGKLQ